MSSRVRCAPRSARARVALGVGAATLTCLGGLGSLGPSACANHLTSSAEPCYVDPTRAPTTFSVTVLVEDEHGAPLAGTSLDRGDGAALSTGADGQATLANLDGSQLVIASAPGFLSEPVPLGWTDAGQVLTVRLWATTGPSGATRWAMHNGGDTMLGRRYETPTDGTPPLIPQATAAAGASSVVSGLARAFALADFKTVNLETTVTDRGDDAQYPGKRWILRTRPEALAGLKTLAVTVAGIANNHQRDFLDPGVGDTTAALDALAIPHVGADATDLAEAAFQSSVPGGTSVAMLAYTGVDGTFVNDSYPLEGTPPDSTSGTEFAFKYDELSWMFSGQALDIPAAPRRIGTAWSLFAAAEPTASPLDVAGAFGSLTTVYPQVQDWVVRRGHGGAQPWDAVASPAAIAALKQQSGVGVVVVQLHDGFQFQEPPADSVRASAHAAIDAGADIVIGHHPHVLQGFEIYKGKLIVYSLGNFVFDQDFFTSFGSGMLRTVWEGTSMIEARFLPSELVNYRPMFATGGGALYGALRMWDRSLVRAASTRDPNDATQLRWVDAEPDANTVLPTLTLDRNTVLVSSTARAPVPLSVVAAPHAITPLGFTGLVEATLGQTSTSPLFVGRDLFGWGRFEDETVDPTVKGGTHWALGSGATAGGAGDCSDGIATGGAATGRNFLRLHRTSFDGDALAVRASARIPTVRHRLWTLTKPVATGIDPDPSFSLHFTARGSGSSATSVRLEFFQFDDANPTEDPVSSATSTLEIPISVTSDWQTLDLPIDPSVLGADTTSNMVFFYFELAVPGDGESELDVDDVSFVEWRQASGMPDRFGPYLFVRNDGDAPVTVSTTGMSLLAPPAL